MSALPFQGGVIFRTFVPDSGFGTYAMLTAMVILPLEQLRLPVVNEMHTKSYTGPRLQLLVLPLLLRWDEVRVCGDFSVTYNACAEVETYPMPKIEDMHSSLRGCQVFSVLDLKQAYHQIPISTESQKYLTINTHLGLFALKRLLNVIHSGPAIFQRIMDGL